MTNTKFIEYVEKIRTWHIVAFTSLLPIGIGALYFYSKQEAIKELATVESLNRNILFIFTIFITAFFSIISYLILVILSIKRSNIRTDRLRFYIEKLREYTVSRMPMGDANFEAFVMAGGMVEPPPVEVPMDDLDERPVSTKERTTLLCIIAALCEDAGYDRSKTAKTAGLIVSSATRMGISIGETTIEGHLKKIPDALERRMK